MEFAPLASDETGADAADAKPLRGAESSGCCWRSAAAAAAVLLVLLVGTLFVGRAVELRAVARTPSTDNLYFSDWVCARDEAGHERSVSNHSLLVSSSGTLSVVHCAKCGACSSESDMAIYKATRLNITQTAASVALGVFLGGEQAVRDGFRDRIGFTDACNYCWTADVLCSQRHCKFTCLAQMLVGGGLSEMANGDADGGLNDCIRCDERMCGPDFARCAGNNRRRAGIHSDIRRPVEQLCGQL